MRTSLIAKIAIGFFAVIGLAAVTVGFKHGHHGPRDPAKVQKYVAFHVDDVLDDVDANDKQKAAVQASVAEVVDAAFELRADREIIRDAFLDAWASEDLDPATLDTLVEQKISQLRKVAKVATRELAEIHGTLTPDQRAELAERLEKRRR